MNSTKTLNDRVNFYRSKCQALEAENERIRHAAKAVTHHLQWYVEEDGVVQIDPDPLRKLERALAGGEG